MAITQLMESSGLVACKYGSAGHRPTQMHVFGFYAEEVPKHYLQSALGKRDWKFAAEYHVVAQKGRSNVSCTLPSFSLLGEFSKEDVLSMTGNFWLPPAPEHFKCA